MRLKDILLEGSKEFELTTTDIDPETGSVTSKVTYTNPLLQVDKDIQKIYDNLLKAVDKNSEDNKLKQLFDELGIWKKKFRTYATRNKLYTK